MLLGLLGSTGIVYTNVWCGRSEINYFISTHLSYAVYEHGWQNLLNNNVVRAAASSWNNVRGDDDRWPRLNEVAYGEWDIMVDVNDNDDEDYSCSYSHDSMVLGYYDPEGYIVLCATPFEGSYYVNSTHVQAVVAHEFGHSSGSDHVEQPGLMYWLDPYTNFGFYTPQPVDEQHLNSIYQNICGGAGGGPRPCNDPSMYCPYSYNLYMEGGG